MSDATRSLAEMFEARRQQPVDEVEEAIATALRDFVIEGSPGLADFAENLPWYWNPQAAKIAAALRERFDVTPKGEPS